MPTTTTSAVRTGAGWAVRGWTRRIHPLSWHHPQAVLAMRTWLAAGLAWLAIQPAGEFARNYPYYAPLGAMVPTSTNIVGSIRSSAHREQRAETAEGVIA